MAEVMSDRREATRYALTLVAEIFEPLNSSTLNARTSDVSRSGCYVDSLSPLPPGVEIAIQLRSGEEVFQTQARVVYISPGLGMGVHWGALPNEKSLNMLDRWLQKAAKSPI